MDTALRVPCSSTFLNFLNVSALDTFAAKGVSPSGQSRPELKTGVPVQKFTDLSSYQDLMNRHQSCSHFEAAMLVATWTQIFCTRQYVSCHYWSVRARGFDWEPSIKEMMYLIHSERLRNILRAPSCVSRSILYFVPGRAVSDSCALSTALRPCSAL